MHLLTRSSDIAFYGINLNQAVILARIGYAKGATPYDTLHKTAIGNIIMQAAVNYQIFFFFDIPTLIRYRATFLATT
jgi:hypothetical protein